MSVEWQATYTGYSPWARTCSQTQRIYGAEPDAARKFPVIVFTHATGSDLSGNLEGRQFVKLAAERGWVAAAPTYASSLTNSVGGVLAHAGCIFPASLTAVAARPKADLSRFVVAGFSQGGAIAMMARNYDARVAAAWVMGVSGPQTPAFISCEHGGFRKLPDARLRINVGQFDQEVADPSRTALEALTGDAGGLRTDGSGYYIVGNDEVQDEVADHCYRWYTQQTPASSCGKISTSPPDAGFVAPSRLPWSLLASLEWLQTRLT